MDVKDMDVVNPIYDLIESGDNYSKIPGKLCQQYRNKPALNNTDAVI